MPRTYKITREGGDVSEYAYAPDAAAAIRGITGEDYRRFSDDVQELVDMKPGDEHTLIDGVNLLVTDTEDQGQTPPPETTPEGKPQDPKLVLPTDEKSAAKSPDTKSHNVTNPQSEPTGSTKK